MEHPSIVAGAYEYSAPTGYQLVFSVAQPILKIVVHWPQALNLNTYARGFDILLHVYGIKLNMFNI